MVMILSPFPSYVGSCVSHKERNGELRGSKTKVVTMYSRRMVH